MNKDTCVIIPVYNKAGAVGEVIAAVKKEFSHILCVDDGSTDNSVEVVLKTGVELVRHPANRGQGAALRTGIKQALKDPRLKYFITFDADGQHSVKDAVKMRAYIGKKNLDIVMGSRFLGSALGLSNTKRLVLKLAVWFSNVTTGLRLTDTHNGLRIFNRQVAAKMELTCAGMAHASEIIYRVADNKFNYAEFPVTITYTSYSMANGQSVLNSFNIMKELVAYRLQREVSQAETLAN